MSEISDVPQTPFAIAFQLAHIVAVAENKPLRASGVGAPGVNREYVLTLYRDCLEVVASQGTMFTQRG